jgi:hypothetical protein
MTTELLGYRFEPMDDNDWQTFAGADEGTLICYLDNGTALLLSPDGELNEVRPDGSEFTWTCRDSGAARSPIGRS